MGVDIFINTNIDDVVFSTDYHEPVNDYFHKHNLSRTFCKLMSRGDVVNGETELDQISKLVSIDISPIYQMETYGSDNGEELEFFLETAESEEERQSILNEAQKNKDSLKGNIDKVLSTISELLDKLSNIDNLPASLKDNGFDTLDNKIYFADFNVDKGEGYIDNNFGQDLRNFERFVKFAKAKGASTVYFTYG